MESSSSTEPKETVIEVVKMLDDGSLEIRHCVLMRDGPRPSPTGWNSKPGSPDFIEFATRHGITQPGQISTIRKELRDDGLWHESQVKEGAG